MKQIFITLFLITFLTSFGFGQIQIGGEQPKAKKGKHQQTKKEPNDSTVYDLKVFLGASFGSAYRTLTPNTKNPLFADSLGERENETRSKSWGVNLGFTSDISKYFMWEAGVSLFQNGEKYSFQAVDSSHSYTSKYSWIGIPLKIYFKYDLKKLRIQAGGGIVAQMQFKYRQQEEFVNSKGTTTTSEIKTVKNVNSFGISAIANAGIHYSITKRFGAYLLFEYRHQLTPSHLKTYPYIHKGTAIGANVGFTFGL